MNHKLIQIVYALSPGGSELLATRLASRLHRTGRYAASVYAVSHGGALEPVLAGEGLPYRAFGRASFLDRRAFVGLYGALREARPAIVHTHHLGQLLYAGAAARLAGARLVHTEHEFYTLARRRHQILLRALATVADVVTAVAPPVADFLIREVGIPARKIRVIPNGVDVDTFRTAKPADRATWGWNERHRIVACIGRLSPEKGQRVLLEAFRTVAARRPDTRLLFVGDGADRERLMEQADAWQLGRAVRFLGARPDVANVLGACDVVVLPSFHEGLPLVALEAMAAGKPVIATSVGALPDLLGDHDGCLVPPGNASTLAQACLALLANDDRMARIGAAGRARVERDHHFDHTVRRYEQVYAEVLR